MAFKLDLSEKFDYPVKFTTVSATGKQQSNQITFIFSRLNHEKIIELKLDSANDDELSPTEVIDKDVAFLLRFTEGWKDVNIFGETEFTPDNLRTLVSSVPFISREIFFAFLEASTGGEQKKIK